MRWVVLTICVALTAGCTTSSPDRSGAMPAAETLAASQADVARFLTVQQRIEPVAEATCRARIPGANCDFKIILDQRASTSPNAFQTVDQSGRPVLALNAALIAQARSADEIAFILSHEAAHHIRGHLAQTQQNAQTGALVFAVLAQLAGAGDGAVRSAFEVGATVGSRTYSKDFELEADYLGALISRQAGFDALRGAQFFDRIPDPGDAFLASHPANAQRIDTVRQAVRER